MCFISHYYSETGASEHVLGEVLTAMDGVEGQSGQVILIAATNRMDKLDSVGYSGSPSVYHCYHVLSYE